MEDAFSHVGNHLISDSAAAIKAGGDDLSTLNADALYASGHVGRRRADDDDNQTDLYNDDDNDSLASAPVGALQDLKLGSYVEEDHEPPAHACAYVSPRSLPLPPCQVSPDRRH